MKRIAIGLYEAEEMVASEVRILPTEYDHHGTTFEQIDRTENAAIYKDKNDDVWEVFKVKVAKATTIKTNGEAKDVPAREQIPGNEDFGVWAWCITKNEEKAKQKYNEIK